MTRLTPDPDLNQLVRELNEGDRPRDSEPMGLVPEGNPLERLLHDMVQRTASDLFLVAGAPPVMRLGGRLTKLESPPPPRTRFTMSSCRFFRRESESGGAGRRGRFLHSSVGRR